MVGVPSLIDALVPDAQNTNFPYPKLVQVYDPAVGAYTYEGPTINGQPMPGQWLLTEATRVFGWEERVGNYLTGATLVPKGDPLLLAKYSIRIWSSADVGLYRTLLGTILKKPVIQLAGLSSGLIQTNAATAVLGIDDPSLKDVGVTKVVVWSVTPLINPLVGSGGRGPWTAAVEFKEYRKPRPALPIPDQTIPDVGPVTPSSFSAMQAENANITQGTKDLQSATARQLLNR